MVTVPVEVALCWHTCHICKTVLGRSTVPWGQVAAVGSQHLRAQQGCSTLVCEVCTQKWNILRAPADPNTQPPTFLAAREGLRTEQLQWCSCEGQGSRGSLHCLDCLQEGSGITNNLARHLKAA